MHIFLCSCYMIHFIIVIITINFLAQTLCLANSNLSNMSHDKETIKNLWASNYFAQKKDNRPEHSCIMCFVLLQANLVCTTSTCCNIVMLQLYCVSLSNHLHNYHQASSILFLCSFLHAEHVFLQSVLLSLHVFLKEISFHWHCVDGRRVLLGAFTITWFPSYLFHGKWLSAGFKHTLEYWFRTKQLKKHIEMAFAG